MRLKGFEALSFDCYGTLIDWETGILAALAPWRARTPRRGRRHGAARRLRPARNGPAGRRRGPALQRASHAGGGGAGPTSSGHRRRRRRPGPSAARCRTGRPLRTAPPALAYVQAALHADRALERRRGELSRQQPNGWASPSPPCSPPRRSAATSPTRAIFPVFSNGPAPGASRARKLLHVAESLHHDHVPAKAVGLRTAWIHRRHAKGGFGATTAPAVEVTPDFRFTSLGELAEAYRREAAGGAPTRQGHRQAPFWIAIFLVLASALADFGRITVSTPLSNLASTLSSSISIGIGVCRHEGAVGALHEVVAFFFLLALLLLLALDRQDAVGELHVDLLLVDARQLGVHLDRLVGLLGRRPAAPWDPCPWPDG